MSVEEKTLQQTLEEIQGEQSANSSQSKETDEGISNNEGEGETNSGVTPEYLSGVDISDIPEQERPRIKELAKKKLDLLEKGYQPKFQKVAQLEKTLEWLQSEGLSPQEAEQQLRAYAQQKKNPVTTVQDKKEAVKTLDTLIQTSPVEQRQALEQMRTIILEETNVSSLQKKFEDLEKVVGYFTNSAAQTKQKEISNELETTFTKKLGKEFIEKHKDVIVRAALNHPNVGLYKIIKDQTPDDEFEDALLANKLGNKKPLTTEKINAISSSGQGVSIAKDTVDTNKSWKEVLRDLTKK